MADIDRKQATIAQAAWLRALQKTAGIAGNPSRTFPNVIAELAQHHGDALALVSDASSLSFGGLDARANQYANWAIAEGLMRGGIVCLAMPNSPEYLAAWVGITRAGGTVALLNTQQTGTALAHAIGSVRPKLLIAGGGAQAGHMRAIRPQLDPRLRAWSDHDAGSGFSRLDLALAAMDTAPAARPSHAVPMLGDCALYIYTSGTTGLPKAARVSHHRVMQWSHWFAGMMDTQRTDRMYNVLPMYHAIGGVVATGAVLVNGGSVRIAERFSAHRFWDDVSDSECTLFQYIGELCRYLVNAPAHPRERAHRLRLACGNGLSLPVWQAFQKRFNVGAILEYYAATEGTFSLYNCEGRPGAIGRIPPYLRPRMPVALIEHDAETGLPARAADGFCVKCAPGGVGEAIGRIKLADGTGSAQFEGYTDIAASTAKLLRDVFKPGDAWYRTGDLMRTDEHGFYYFVDRVGETFRWKGENVSATEVAGIIAQCSGVQEAIVYGVEVPGTEGRAGMAAIVTGEGFDLATLWRHVRAELAAYARPLFVRLLPDLETTATFKPRKNDYQHDGFDPARTADPIYFGDTAAGEFVPLDRPLYDRILSGSVRL